MQALSQITHLPISILAVEDVIAREIDEQSKTVYGTVDLNTAPLNGTLGYADFKSKWVYRSNNFFLCPTKNHKYRDQYGNYSGILDVIFKKLGTNIDQSLFEVTKSINGTRIIKFTDANHADITVQKVKNFGFTLDEKDCKNLHIEYHPGEIFFKAFRVIQAPFSFPKEPGEFSDPQDMLNYEEFCKGCYITRDCYPPYLKKS